MLRTLLRLSQYLLVVLDINCRPLLLPSRKATVEHDINLAVEVAVHLRQTEICDKETETGN